jgi:glucuronoarabinoxylan endo-1,4-beta-xylanase
MIPYPVTQLRSNPGLKSLKILHWCSFLLGSVGGFAQGQIQTNSIFHETFDTASTPPGANALGWSGGAGLSNIVVTYVDGAGVNSGRALVIQADFTQAGSGYVAYQFSAPYANLNPSVTLADYRLSFDVKVNNPGLAALQCTLQAWDNVNYGGPMTATPTGSIPLGAYTPGVFKHISVSLSDSTVWPGVNSFNPAGGTWQVQLQVNGWNGAAVNVGEQVTIDNLALEMTFSDTAQATVNWDNVYQRIDGFGAASSWTAPALSDSQADMFFSTNNGIGLSILRNRIAPDGTTLELVTMQKAQARGAKIWSAPWSPPVAYKDSGTVNGGNFVSSVANYQGYANQLATYVANMKSNGVNLYAISVQNEPDYNTTSYESCVWNGQQFHDFLPYLSSALSTQNVGGTRILFPEDAHWQFNLTTAVMNDTDTAAMASILAAHNYGSSVTPVNNYGKALWETEIATFDNFDGSITNALYWARQIHRFMTVAQVNAWHFWWLIPFGTDNEALTDTNGNPAKRMYALGNYSRFIRPGYYRIGATNSNPIVLLSAYKESVSGKFALTAINMGSTSVTQTFNLAGFTASLATQWLTSAASSLGSQPDIVISSNVFTHVLPAFTVTTFTGQAAQASPPMLTLQRTAAGIAISWATNSVGFSLESSTSIASSIWQPVSPPPAVVGDQNFVTNSISNLANFYRLRKPL